MLDIHTVGAGGGSIASVDAGGRLRVGPESAGARPGPACYGTGEQATVTDAHVVLRRILPEHFLDGTMRIDVRRAEEAVCKIGHDLGMSTEESARAIVRIANSNMERAIRVVSAERGRDPRDFPLVAFGGCGGLHACEIAEELGISTVIFPAYAGALSALGMLLAARARDYAAGALGREDYRTIFAELRNQASIDMPGAAIEEFADIRYRGQSYELTVAWNCAEPRQPFEEAYQQIYGFSDPQRAIEVVTARVRSTQPKDTSWFDRLNPERGLTAPREGPALLFEYGSTISIPAGWTLEPRPGGSLVALAENVDALTLPA
jgi:N-methylhydantoinase A/oxoprolinase/acetone carboxylase beta subunit